MRFSRRFVGKKIKKLFLHTSWNALGKRGKMDAGTEREHNAIPRYSVIMRAGNHSRLNSRMGLRDRDYAQSEFSREKKHRPRRSRRTNDRSVTGILIFINVVLWFANGLFFVGNNLLTDFLMLRVGDLNLNSCYKLLTYGFVHSPSRWQHIFFNMFGLLMFGYGLMFGIGPGGFGFFRSDSVEERLGRLEFTVFYLVTLIVGGIVYTLINATNPLAGVFGASGGVSGVIILFAWLFPRKTLWLWGILPLPMWAIGLLLVLMDAWGAAGYGCGGIAYSVHLAGAACATLYYFLFVKSEITLSGWLESSQQHKPKLRIHSPKNFTPDSTPDSLEDDEFNRLLDDVLKRYGEVGEAGLTPEEREFLQRASRKFSEKHLR